MTQRTYWHLQGLGRVPSEYDIASSRLLYYPTLGFAVDTPVSAWYARYQAGYSPYLEVLDAQRTANDAELAFVRNRQARLAFSVDLMKALGGGWNSGSENSGSGS